MKQLQRIIVFTGLLVAIFALPLLKNDYRRQQYTDSVMRAEAEAFLGDLCRTGICTEELYEEYAERVFRLTDGEEKLQLEVYQRLTDMSGTEYRYLITWEEIKTDLRENGYHQFAENSEVYVVVGDDIYGGLFLGRE